VTSATPPQPPTPAPTGLPTPALPAEQVGLWPLVGYFLTLGTIGFGGPVALTGYMHRDLVEQRRWISEAEYKEGLALAQLAPGPLAAQLAIYLGYARHGLLGATLVGLAFPAPSFVLVLAAGWAYVTYQGLDWLQALFYGVGAAVIAIIAHQATKLTRRTLGRDRLLAAIFLVVASVTVVTETENGLLILAAGVLVWLVRARPRRLRFPRRGRGLAALLVPLPAAAVTAPAAEPGVLWQIAVYFGQAGAFVFGSGLAIVPFLYGGVVGTYGWLTDRQFLDAVAVALLTPGPVVITTGFIGYLVAGLPGAVVAAVATFLPCYLLTIIPAPWFRRHGKHPAVAAFVDGVTAGAIGAIAGAVVVLGRRSIIDLPTILIAAATLLALVKLGRRAPEPLVVAAAGLLGLAISH
jgi:chromate transporter